MGISIPLSLDSQRTSEWYVGSKVEIEIEIEIEVTNVRENGRRRLYGSTMRCIHYYKLLFSLSQTRKK